MELYSILFFTLFSSIAALTLPIGKNSTFLTSTVHNSADEAKCEEFKPNCLETGGSCMYTEDKSVFCACPHVTVYNDGIGCQVPDSECNKKYKGCSTTGGTCKVDKEGTAFYCDCKAGTIYEEETGCKVPDSECNKKYKGCTTTGGTCKVDKEGTAFYCDCKAGIIYEEETGCKGMCSQYLQNCEENGGTCIKEKNEEFKCVCPQDTDYVVGFGCRITLEGKCSEIKPSCEETGGFCVSDKQKKFQCHCPKRMEYREDVGCTGVCKKNSECKNGGSCKEYGSLKTCSCLKGTEGPFCEVIPSCKDVYCGFEAQCTYDSESELGKCKCMEEKKTYDVSDKKCKIKCGGGTVCEGNKICNADDVCECKVGYEGDQCDVIAGCKYLKEKCDAIKKDCIFDEEAPEKATCQCNEGYAYDRKANECRIKCERGIGCEGNKICNSDEFCECRDGYEGDQCEVITGCKQLKEKCDEIKKDCMFDEEAPEKATCKCEGDDVYDRNENECKKKMQDFCEDVCGKDYGVECMGDKTRREGIICACIDYAKVFDMDSKKCKEKPQDFCEDVCGKYPGVTCDGDKTNKEKITCNCKDHTKVFDIIRKTCKEKRQDFCEDVCGKYPGVTCHGNKTNKENITCNCEDNTKVFDKTSKTCKDLISLEDSGIHISLYFHNKNSSMNDTKFDFHFGRREDSNRTRTQLLLRLNSEYVFPTPDRKCSKVTCKNGGICVIENEKTVCNCTDKYTGDYCEKECNCKNGKCKDVLGKTECVCYPEYGKYKEGVCKACECGKGANCNFTAGKFWPHKNKTCICPENFIEADGICVDPDLHNPCLNNPCKNGGLCKADGVRAKCVCLPGYSGDLCEDDECLWIKCKNGGTCVMNNGKAFCECTDKYIGDFCEQDKCSLMKCLNGGKCEIINEKTVCVCNDAFTGDFCEKDKCSLIKCQNGGKCNISNGQARCYCPANFSGDHCERRHRNLYIRK